MDKQAAPEVHSLTKGFGTEREVIQRGQEVQKEGVSGLFVNDAGGKESIKPAILWTSEKPGCFKGVDKAAYSELLLACKVMGGRRHYASCPSQGKQPIEVTKRSAVLLMDNTGCIPTRSFREYSNIKIMFQKLAV